MGKSRIKEAMKLLEKKIIKHIDLGDNPGPEVNILENLYQIKAIRQSLKRNKKRSKGC